MDNGATAFQLMAIFGWTDLRMAEKYTRKANQAKLARSAMHMLEAQEQKRHRIVSHRTHEWDFFEKNVVKSMTSFGDGARGGCVAIEQTQGVMASNPPKVFH